MKFLEKTEWELFYPLYLALFIGVAIPDIDMVIMVFFLSKGFTATQVGVGLSLQSLFLLLSEIPTGAFADLFGKRKSVQVSWFMQSLIFAVFFFISKPWMMWLLFSLKGIAHTFSTGAFEALPYEIAKKAKREDLIDKYYSTYEFVYQTATAFSNLNVIIFLLLIGATNIYNILGQPHPGLDFLWLTGSLGYFVGTLILFRLKEKVSKAKSHIQNDMKNAYKLATKAISYTTTHEIVRSLVLVGIFIKLTIMLFSDIVYQPFLLGLGIKNENIAIMVAIGSAIAAIFSLLSKRINKKISTEKRYLETMMILKIAVLVSLLLFAGPIFSIIFFFIYFGFDSLINPVLNPFKQFFYKKDIRATLGSVESVAKNLIAIIFFPLIGYSMDTLGPNKTVLLSIAPLLTGYLIFRGIKQEGRLIH